MAENKWVPSPEYIKQNDEANAFACFLLMPENLLLPFLEEMKAKKVYDDDLLIAVSKRFEVPLFAAAHRLHLLKQKRDNEIISNY